MNITTKGRYALRVMTDLAMNKDGAFVPLSAISQREELSAKYLEMIVGGLKKAGLVESSRGKEGGYRLNRTPDQYTVGEILLSADDCLSPVACVKEGHTDCQRADRCLSLPMWQEIDGIINNYFASVTLQDLLTGERWKNTDSHGCQP